MSYPTHSDHHPALGCRRAPALRLGLLLTGLVFAAESASAAPTELRIRPLLGTSTVVRRPVVRPAGGGGGAGAGASLENGSFDDALGGWRVSESGGSEFPGDVVADAGRANFTEGDSFLTTLEQSFLVPPEAAALSFELSLEPGFDRSDAAIPDAFEISILDENLSPVLSTWDEVATSNFNLQEDGTAHFDAELVSWDGTTCRLDLSGVEAGRRVTLYFDLIGADADNETRLSLDNVALEREIDPPDEGLFRRGDANSDGGLDLSDPVYTLNWLFLGGPVPACMEAANANDDRTVDLSDPVFSLNFLFLGGPPIPAPYPDCGFDPAPVDALDCEDGAPCA